ncbi:bifunctional 2-C-methyl-D-erythritol 4-phosphate cytidylyltransferase/2-C-methyl-D-erythritol 2,4-cyclodiphosphate synthase [Pontixanthobacter sp.]|uniref:bifunctional 2-C-methyl-D-erythritol 4-phosphate cytidylyltransferase/2-C-methyl-D-erythritol 2,4-cyclodiphosphate synthase n=1 Tax=Pontixanthobacter sp. TaxID=2792078 RepID=UPI003C7A85C7
MDTSPSPCKPAKLAAIIVAAGKGLRAGQVLPKQFAIWRGKPVLRHSADAFIRGGAAPVVVVIPQGTGDIAKAALAGLSGIRLVIGGATRQDSVRAGLESLAGTDTDIVMIHDAARAVLPDAVITRLRDAVLRSDGAVPVLPVVDSLAVDTDGMMAGSADRTALRRVQTPQAFQFSTILAAHRAWSEPGSAGDDAQVLRAAGGTVTHVAGDEALKKLTFAEDFMTGLPMVRTGMGYDVHRLVKGEELWLGGLKIPHDKGLSGHSDADVALHAVVDALLGAIAAGDIGDHFPPSDPQWKGAASGRFVEHAAQLVSQAGYSIANVDLTLICEAPKIGSHRNAMRAEIARLLSVDIGQVSVKATTTERLGFAGRREGIAAQAIATVFNTHPA